MFKIFKKRKKLIEGKDISRYKDKELELGSHIDNFISLLSTGALVFILSNSGRDEIFNLHREGINEIAVLLFVAAIIFSLINRVVIFEATNSHVKKYYRGAPGEFHEEKSVVIEESGLFNFFIVLTHYIAVLAVIGGITISLLSLLKFY